MTGCHTPTVPSAAWQLSQSTAEPVTTITRPLDAALEIKNATAVASRVAYSWGNASYDFVYTLQFDLVETAGESGARIYEMQATVADELHAVLDSECIKQFRVGAGGSVRIDLNAVGYGCEPFAASRALASTVSLEIAFIDDNGRRASVVAIVPVTK
jgi:hypothetical protein